MTKIAKNKPDFVAPVATIQYAAGCLADILLDCQRNQVTGLIRVTALMDDRVAQYAILLCDGSLIYAGRAIPTPYEFVVELTQYTYVGVLDAVLAFAAKRSSIQSVVRAMVDIGVLQWAEIAAALRKQALAVLEDLLPTAGRIALESSPTTFDLQYGEAESGFIVGALLLESKLRCQGSDLLAAAVATDDTKPTILSVDDSPVSQALVKRALGDDYETISCNHPFKAMSILNSRKDISMLLLDLTLPGMDGLEFCRMLRGTEEYKSLPIVILTARGGAIDRVRGRFSGATHYLTKPVQPAELLAVVAQCLA